MAQHHRVPITIRIDQFEGPLDLLLYLISSHELDVNEISISKITDQYLDYVRIMQELNFDIASEFLVMAATLIYWKSKAILPRDEEDQIEDLDEEDLGPTPQDLLIQLMEHQRFLQAGDRLAELPRLNQDFFIRANKKPPIEKIWREMNISDLALSYQDTLSRSRKSRTLLKKETVSLSDRIMQLGDRLEIGKVTNMEDLMEVNPLKPEKVVTFLAALELSRLSMMKTYQDGTYQAIFVELLESLQSFNVRLATGFDHIQEQVEKEVQA